MYANKDSFIQLNITCNANDNAQHSIAGQPSAEVNIAKTVSKQ